MAKFYGLRFNNIQNPSFLKVKSITHQMLPSIENISIKVPGSPGTIFQNSSLSERIISINVMIVSDEDNILPRNLETLAQWLYSTEPKELVLGDNSNRVYYGMLNGDTSFEEIARLGTGTIEFICFDPYSYGDINTARLINDTYIHTSNSGTAKTPVDIDITIAKPSTYLGININESFIELGETKSIDDTATEIVDVVVINDQCNSLSGWTTSPNILGGSVVGDMGVSNDAFIPDGNEIQETEIVGWYGPSKYKTLKREVTDFAMSVNGMFQRAGDTEQDIYSKNYIVVRDSHNAAYAIIEIYDASLDNNTISVRVGLINNNSVRWFYEAKDIDRNIKKLEYSVNFTRRNNIYSLDMYSIGSGKSIKICTAKFIDNDKVFTGRKAKYFQYGFMRYSKNGYKPGNISYVNIDSLDENTSIQKPIPIIVSEGDRILIKTGAGEVYKNGSLWMKHLNLLSSFEQIRPGVNTISIYPSGISNNAVISYRERYN